MAEVHGEPLPLHRAWEDNRMVRERMRATGLLTDWPAGLAGQPSMRALLMNRTLVELAAVWWCPQKEQPETLAIKKVRYEVGLLPLTSISWA